MMQLSPIVMFCYNRPEHTIKVLEALSENELADESELFIYADGAKENASNEDIAKVNAVRNTIRSKKWTKEVTIIEHVSNKGLANSITEGITEVVNRFGKVIVLEDDIVPRKGFLKFMNESLDLYESDYNVMNISAYMFPYKMPKNTQHTFFLKVAAGWGWATWARAWKSYNPDVEFLMKSLKDKDLVSKFNIDNSHDYFSQLEANKNKKLYTWGIKWYASWFLAEGFNLFPSQSLIENIGFDSTGIHCGSNNSFQSTTTEYILQVRQEVIENKKIRKEIVKFYNRIKTPNRKWWILAVKKIPFITNLYRKYFQSN